MATEGSEQSAASPTPGERQSTKKRRIDMPTFGPLWRIRFSIPHIGGHQIIPGREFTLSQLIIGFVTLMGVGWISGFIFSGPVRLMLAVIAAGLMVMFVARVDSGGRSVWRELQRLTAFSGKCKLHHGAARLDFAHRKRRKRVVAMLEAEKSELDRQQGFFAIVFAGLAEIYSDFMDVYGPRKRRRHGGGEY